jgi:hypothetical protein
MAEIVLLPNGLIAADAEWQPLGTGSNYYDPLRGNDGVASYVGRIYNGTVLDKFVEVSFEDLPAAATAITRVRAGFVVETPTGVLVALALKESGNVLSVISDEASSFASFEVDLPFAPSGAAWTPALVNSTTGRLGAGDPGVGGEARCTYAYLKVDYDSTPGTPTGLTATAAGPGTIGLAWTDVAVGEVQWRVQRCTGAACGGFVDLANLAAGVTNYTDTGLNPSTLYRYRVYAVNAAGSSAFSNIAEATTVAISAAPTALATATMLVAQASTVAPVAVAGAWMIPPFHTRTAEAGALLGHGRLGLVDGLRRFADLMDESAADRRPFLELTPGVELPASAWLAYSGPTWKQFANWVLDGLARDVVGVESSIVPRALVRVETALRCVNARGTFFFDRSTKEIYVHLYDESAPASTTVIALLGFYFSTSGEAHPSLGPDKLTNGDFETYS